MGRQSTMQKKNDRGTRMTWNEDDDISGELLTSRGHEVRSDGHDLNNWCVRCSVGRRRAALQQHSEGLGQVHHGAAGGTCLLPGLL